ncbi:MAG: sigma-70 family RNA polymerase sigma factor [Deltaproteobacteria bacterium]|nr:sigma-70 family RNA polymerase sigma factor [Deltaproteobacteria bacterium]
MAEERPSPTRAPDSLEFVLAAQAGDRAAFDALHRLYRSMVHATLIVRIGASEAEDVMQEAFVTAWLSLPDLRDPAAFGPWLQSIARAKATDRLRRRKKTVPLPETLSVPPRLTLEAREALAALARMPSHLSEPLAMRLLEGMTGPEIADATGLTHGSVRVTLHRAMKRLREELEVSHD